MPQLTIEQAIDLAGQHLRAGRLQEAEAIYRQILTRHSQHAGAIHGLAVIAMQVGRGDMAVELLRQAVALQPDSAAAHSDLGYALRSMGQIDQAIIACRQAILLRPAFAEAHLNLGNVLRDAGRLDQAIDAYRRAIALKPDFAEACNNLGNVLREADRLDEAIDAYHRAIALRPGFAEAHGNLGTVLKNTGQLDEAIDSYRRAVALDPQNSAVHGSLLYALHFHPAYDGHAIGQEHRLWSRRHAGPLGKIVAAHGNEPAPERPLKIGYVSPDFCFHAVGRALLPFFRRHDHRQFEITCYAQVALPDAMTGEFQQNADRWRNITGLSDEQVARQIIEDRIDILVDLTVHTGGNRLLVFARKPAPVQVTYLGYCSTTGLSAMDYRLSDPHFDPPGTDLSQYSEKTVHLPRTYWCYQPAGAAPQPSEAPVRRNGFVTFGCLNNFGKVSSAAADVWAAILAAVTNSQLILHARPGRHLEGITQRFARGGVDPHRVRFIGMQPWTEYMEAYSQIDIALDPFPYGGGITTCDALWMGVPVVSLSGRTPVGRGGRSILSNLGLPELIACTPDQYVRIAAELAGDVERMDNLRRGMRGRMLASPLMDAPQFARDVEAAYRRMWRTWCDSNGGGVRDTLGGTL